MGLLLQGSNDLLPPAEILPLLSGANLSDSSNPLYVSFDRNRRKVAELTDRIEAVITELSHALLKTTIPGEAELLSEEDNFKMAVRRILPGDEALRSNLSVSADESFLLPAGLLDNQVGRAPPCAHTCSQPKR